MSISYYGVATHDPSLIGVLLEGRGASPIAPIDVKAVRAALVKQTALRGGVNGGTLKWEGDGTYVFVDVSERTVAVTQGFGGGERVIDVLIDVSAVLGAAGLHIWDPQQGWWFGEARPKSTKSKRAAKKPAKNALQKKRSAVQKARKKR